MELALSLWALPGLLGAAVALVAARIAWRRRANPGALELVSLSFAVGWWSLFQAVVDVLPTLEGKLLATRLQFIGIAAVPLLWLWFTVRYTAGARLVSPLGWTMLALPQIAIVLLAWTNAWHGLIWRDVRLGSDAGTGPLIVDYGQWFRAWVYYAYGLVVIGLGLLIAAFTQSTHQQHRLIVLMMAALLPVAVSLLSLLNVVGPLSVDLIPAGLAIGGLVLAWSLLKDQLLELPPIARARILESIQDGLLVLDHRGTILDANSAATALLSCQIGDTLDTPFLGARPDLDAAHAGVPSSSTVEREGRMLETSWTSTPDVPGGGVIVIIRDVTERHQLQRELEHLSSELVRTNLELTQLANTDSLTGLANRRQLLAVVELELRRAIRYGHPLSMLLLDVDHFKTVNDTLGHAAGDALLCDLAQVIRDSVREIDVIGRLGGDELAIVLPATDVEGATATALRLLKRIAERRFGPEDGPPLHVTASMGLVHVHGPATDADQLLNLADIALYQAKRGGRNQLRSVALGDDGASAESPP